MRGRLRRLLLAAALPAILAAGPARAAGVAVLQVPPPPPGAPSGLAAGDVLTSWRAGGAGGELQTPLDWLWLQAGWGRRRTVEVAVIRHGAPRWVRLPLGMGGIVAGPALPPDLAARAASLPDHPPDPAAAGAAVEELRRAAGPGAALWLRLELARRWLDRGAPRPVLHLLDGAAGEAATPGDPRATVLVLRLRIRALLALHRVREAGAAVGRALDLVRRCADPQPARAELLRWSGLVEQARGHLRRAEAALERALSLEERLAPESPAGAVTRARLGKVLFELGRHGEGVRLLRRSVEILRKAAPGSLELAASLNTLGGLELERGRLDAARRALLESRAIRRRLPGRPGLYKSLYNLGLIAYLQRRLEDAARLFAEAERILQEREPGGAHMAQLLDAAMAVAQERCALDEAERLGRRALALHRKLDPASLETAACLLNLGVVARAQEDLALARKRYGEALAIAREAAPEGADAATILADLAELDLEEGRNRRALERSRRALERLEALGAPPVNLAHLHHNIAAAALGLGDLDLAGRECRAALELRRRAAPGSRNEGQSRVLLGTIEEARGRLDRAAACYDRAIAILREVAPGTVTLAEALHHRAVLQHKRGDRAGAIRSLRSAVEALEEQIRRLGGTARVRSAFRARYDGWYHELAVLLAAEGRAAEAFGILERSRARSFLAMLAAHDLSPSSGAAVDLERRRRELARRSDRLLSELARAPAAQRAALRARLDGLRRRQDRLWEELRRAAPRLAALERPALVDAGSGAALLDRETAVLAYSPGERSTLLLLLEATGQVHAYTIPLGEPDLERAVGLFRGLIRSRAGAPGRHRALERAASVLGEALVGPALPRLGTVHTLIVLPGGALHLLPFSCLTVPSGEAGVPLGERYAVAVEPSLSVVARLRRRSARRAAGRELLAVAYPGPPPPGVTAAVGGGDRPLGAIPGTVAEARAVARIWGPAGRLLSGGEATEARLRALAPRAALLHIAAHVLTDTLHPLDSAIVLRPGGGNGLLQAWEVMGSLDLPGSLVTLSGCETALGARRPGEGLVGLTRAFLHAGARTVVASLWRVDDRATSRLMERFYSHLAAGLPVAEALRRARTGLRHTTGRPGLLDRLAALLGRSPRASPPSDPSIWAAFQVQGDPTATFPR